MKRFLLIALLPASVALAALSAFAATPKAKAGSETRNANVQAVRTGDAVAGKAKSENERCQECHGVDGNGHGTEGKFAKLAGQYPEYIVKQIRDFRTATRKHDFMAMMARSIDDADLADIAAYFGSLPKMQGDGSGGELGKNLFVNGDAARHIAPCISCHGASGKGGSPAFPVIGGQDVRYLERQLLDWRSGERRNSAGGVMNGIAHSLSDAEIQALAHYVSGL